MWTAQHYRFDRPRTFLTPGLVHGIRIAGRQGAATASPGQDVWCIAGDGGIQMNIQELVTAVNYCLPVKIAIMNNGYLGMVRQWQEMFMKGDMPVPSCREPGFCKGTRPSERLV